MPARPLPDQKIAIHPIVSNSHNCCKGSFAPGHLAIWPSGGLARGHPGLGSMFAITLPIAPVPRPLGSQEPRTGMRHLQVCDYRLRVAKSSGVPLLHKPVRPTDLYRKIVETAY